jgi:1,4-dihydroxy-2-naphthoyl-CoA hydrolase
MSDATPLYSMTRPVRFQDIDAAGIIFFARVFEYLHDAFFECLASRGIDIAAVLSSRAWGMPVVHAEADYRRPLRFGDAVAVELDSADIGESSLTARYTIRDASERARVYCEGRTVHVFIDRDTSRTRPVPDEVRAAFTAAATPAAPHR